MSFMPNDLEKLFGRKTVNNKNNSLSIFIGLFQYKKSYRGMSNFLHGNAGSTIRHN